MKNKYVYTIICKEKGARHIDPVDLYTDFYGYVVPEEYLTEDEISFIKLFELDGMKGAKIEREKISDGYNHDYNGKVFAKIRDTYLDGIRYIEVSNLIHRLCYKFAYYNRHHLHLLPKEYLTKDLCEYAIRLNGYNIKHT